MLVRACIVWLRLSLCVCEWQAAARLQRCSGMTRTESLQQVSCVWASVTVWASLRLSVVAGPFV
jgi:hypothetical protein